MADGITASEIRSRIADYGVSNSHDTPRIVELLMNYRPSRTPNRAWREHRTFVLRAVLDCEPTGWDEFRNSLYAIAGYVHWATSTLGAPLDREDLFYPDLINRYASQRWGTAGSISINGTRLLNIASALGGHPVARMRRNTRQASAPYSVTELAGYDAWARHASTAYHRRLYATVVALAAGAGLLPREILALRSSDVDSTEDGYVVHVQGINGRTVPLRRDWAGLFATTAPFPDGWICNPRTRNGQRPSQLHNSLGNYSKAPRLHRLRASWIVNLMERLPAAEVVAAAGFKSIDSLTRYEPYTNRRSWETLTPLLRLAPGEAD